MEQSRIKIGAVINKSENGESRVFIGLGQKGKDPKYDRTVEIIVRDGEGKVIAQQKNGFIQIFDPRKDPEKLRDKGMISESAYEQMMEKGKRVPPAIKQELYLNLKK